jgi:6,7-dimethyl-8-ribityllumazine synthase
MTPQELHPHLGELCADDLNIAIVVARFNAHITEKLWEGALAAWQACGGDVSALEIVRVPGAFELPLAAQALARSKRFDAVVCLGCVIRGDTDHYDYVCDQAASGLMRVGLDESLPVIFGVLTTDNLEQALERSGGAHGHKGADAIHAAIETALLHRSIAGKKG